MITLHNPDTVVAPASFYSQAAEVGPGKRWLHISGQVGAAPDGTLADGFEAQSDQVWRNIAALLAAADMIDGEPGDRAGAAGGPRPPGRPTGRSGTATWGAIRRPRRS